MNWVRLLFVIFVSFILCLIVNQYFFCPRFSFKNLNPFSGKAIYNPYESTSSDHWVKCNFHAHTRAWNGITNGKGTPADVYHAYDSMNYTVHCVSNYQMIDSTLSHIPGYIPAYEHGYNLFKTHQLVLGSHKICWLDYFFPQTLSNKQHILNYLSSDSNNVVIVNHPSLRNSYSASDFEYLTNYNCIEVLRPKAISLEEWDSALSHGRPVFIVGDDDVHDVFSRGQIGKMCTWINVTEINEKTILNALKTGKCYGMMIGNSTKELPLLKLFKINHDTISVEISKVAQEISFIGQNGRLITSYSNTSTAHYILEPEDHYVRPVITFSDNTKIFLNPAFRYDGIRLPQATVSINTQKTISFRLIGSFILVIWLGMTLFFVFRKRSPANT